MIWNERAGDRYVARITDTTTGASRTVPAPVYALSPDGHTAVGPDFRRLNDMRPGVRLRGHPRPVRTTSSRPRRRASTPWTWTPAKPARSSPWPTRPLSRIGTATCPQAKHYFNHLLFSPDGSRFIFLHRWRTPGVRGMRTRMFTAAADGSDLHVVDDYGSMSHFIWRDPETILAWSWQPSHEGAFYLYRDRTDQVEVIGKHAMTLNGHCTYLSDPDWILNDCYPREGNHARNAAAAHHGVGYGVVSAAVGGETLHAAAARVVHGFVARRGTDPAEGLAQAACRDHDPLQVGAIRVRIDLLRSAGWIGADVVQTAVDEQVVGSRDLTVDGVGREILHNLG